jgi:glutaredoxin
MRALPTVGVDRQSGGGRSAGPVAREASDPAAFTPVAVALHRDSIAVAEGDGRRDSLAVVPARHHIASVTVYSKPDCHLCADAMALLRRLQQELGFALEERDITADEALHRAYFERIPVVTLDGEELCQYYVSEAVVRERLESRR